MKIETILALTDFSGPANNAVAQAARLAEDYNARLTLLHARIVTAPDKLPEADDIAGDTGHLAVMRTLVKLKNENNPLDINYEVIYGYSASSAILGFINKQPFDLIVMGTRGQSRSQDFIIGGVTEKIIRYAAPPVLTLPPGTNIKNKFRKIIVPFNFSDHAELALHEAVKIARMYQSQICVISVTEIKKQKTNAENDQSDQKIRRMSVARKKLDAIVQPFKEKEFPDICVDAVEGAAYSEIARYAEEKNGDLIVTATHGAVGIDRFLLGSTVEKMIRVIARPILTLKEKSLI